MMIALLLLCSFLKSLASTSFVLDQVLVSCESSTTCKERRARFQSLVGEYRSPLHLKDTLRVLASDGGYQFFRYSLEQSGESRVLKIDLALKPKIREIHIGFTDRNIEANPNQLISLREGDFFEIQKLKETLKGLKARLAGMGYPKNAHSFVVKEMGDNVDVIITITLGPPLILKQVKPRTESPFIRTFLKRKFLNHYNKPYNVNTFKITLDEAQKELFSYGYYLINLESEVDSKAKRVSPVIQVSNDKLFAFDFKGLDMVSRDDVHAIVLDLFRKYKRPLTEDTLTVALKELYNQRALLNAELEVKTTEFENHKGENVRLYRIYFNERNKTRLVNVTFDGNTYFPDKKLKKMFNREAFELASLKFYDEEYFTYFQDYLRNQYIKRGFVQARVFDPVRVFGDQRKVASVEYDIQEGPRAFVKSIEFPGMPEEFKSKIRDELFNKQGNPFNPIALVEDLKKITTYLQEQGYYYAEIKSSSDSEVVKYNRSGTDVTITFQVDPGPLVRLNRILYLGNDKTKRRVLAKKIDLKPGEVITPSKTREIETVLSSTGLFNTVSVSPLRHSSKNTATDLLVRVSERDYGLIEIAPGYRTDLGIKLTGTVSYQNIGGRFRSITLRSQLNRRTSFTTIDPERRDDIEHIIEHNTTLSYSQADIFDSLIDGNASIAHQTRRFFAFDANIFRINGTLSRELTRRLSTAVRYQYEDITQYNASQELNDGSFQIGAITPSLTYDRRNNPILPTSGLFMNVSTEFANPYFFSQKEPDLTIDYYKFVSRNRFYFPFKNGALAISLVGGIQENLAKETVTIDGEEQTKGYIPTIKVFRLTGMDIVRGFTDEEMNRIPGDRSEDISDVRVANKAYLANFKFEPRYFINDSLMAGVFYDAGRVFVNSVDLGELRESVGLTFKVITPVGTLDFDYGIKLLRKKNPDGSLEDPGRFHVSIGFF